MKTSTLKRFYINVKFEKYGTSIIEARSKEHAIEIYKDGDYGWSDYSEDFGEFNEQIEDVEEELFADTVITRGGFSIMAYCDVCGNFDDEHTDGEPSIKALPDYQPNLYYFWDGRFL